MSLTPSTMMQLGTRAPDFALADVRTGEIISLSDFDNAKGLLVLFICAHCPYVKHVEEELARIGTDYKESGLSIIAISANDDETYPDDAPDRLAEQAERCGFIFPYCHDNSQETAKAYHAACTPDLFLFDDDVELVYRGQLDDSRPGSGKPVTGKDLRAAIDAMLAGEALREDQYPSVGCNIKWKPGNAPDYFG